MGGKGSGRKPSEETIIKRMSPEQNSVGNDLFIPNLSGVKKADNYLKAKGLELSEVTTPTATSNKGKVYTKSDNKLYFQDGAGIEYAVDLTPVFVNDYSINFDGVNDYLNLGSSKLNSDTQGSMSCWIKIPSYSPNNYMISWGGGAISNPGLFGFRIQNDLLGVVQRTNGGPMGGVKGNQTLSYNTWHHGVVTSDGTQWKLYLDGVLQTLTIIIGSNTGNWLGDTSVSSPRKMKIGGGTYNGNDVYYFNGNLDEITVWDRELTQTEVTELYNAGTPFDPSNHSASANLVNYWKMGDGDTYPTITDNIGTFDGTMTNMTASDIENDTP